jgi:hypothetical protein
MTGDALCTAHHHNDNFRRELAFAAQKSFKFLSDAAGLKVTTVFRGVNRSARLLLSCQIKCYHITMKSCGLQNSREFPREILPVVQLIVLLGILETHGLLLCTVTVRAALKVFYFLHSIHAQHPYTAQQASVFRVAEREGR